MRYFGIYRPKVSRFVKACSSKADALAFMKIMQKFVDEKFTINEIEVLSISEYEQLHQQITYWREAYYAERAKIENMRPT